MLRVPMSRAGLSKEDMLSFMANKYRLVLVSTSAVRSANKPAQRPGSAAVAAAAAEEKPLPLLHAHSAGLD